jgi:hypothetical protein
MYFKRPTFFLVWLFRLHLANKRECTITEMVMQLEIIPSHKAVLSGSVIRLRTNWGPVCVIPGRSISPRPFSLHKSFSMDSRVQRIWLFKWKWRTQTPWWVQNLNLRHIYLINVVIFRAVLCSFDFKVWKSTNMT